MAVSIVIADDFPALREGARSWLEKHTDFQVVGEAGDGRETVRLVSRHHPDVLITDTSMPGLSGLEVLSSIRESSPLTRAVVWAPQLQEDHLIAALRQGALAYILKTTSADILIRAVRSALRGNHYLDGAATQRPLEFYLKRAQTELRDPVAELTPREREVLHLVANGSSSAEIARHLHISPRTVEQHRARMMRKLHLRNQIELTRFALRRGILPWEE
jgi:DNA-binding NarL/FixJ family response regulator